MPSPDVPAPPSPSADSGDAAPRLCVRDDVALASLDAAAWDRLAGGEPLASHAFLTALHASGAASPATGWQPRYLTAWRGDALAGALPLYAKSHSYGEYVFDWAWADAYRRHARRYYPKLVAAIPFTPVTGPRILADDDDVRDALLARALASLHHGGFSSLHVLFTAGADVPATARAGMIARTGVQFHWSNRGWRDFDDYLAALNHDKRKKIRQERRRVAASGIAFERRTGRDIRAADWDFFHRCYVNTYRAHGSTPYLPRAFFARIAEAMPDNLLMVTGRRDGVPLCAAFDVFSPRTLWGRYWGAVDYVPGVHFEACYYQAIEFAIERGLATFEGGAQGVHKLARGLTPVITHSAHAIADPAFAEAIAAYCAEERADVAHAGDELERASPFRRDAGATLDR